MYISLSQDLRYLQESYGFEFMEPLLSDMVQEDPAKRPLASDVVARFQVIRASLSTWKLRSRIVWRDERRITRVFNHFIHIFRTLRYILTRKPTICLP